MVIKKNLETKLGFVVILNWEVRMLKSASHPYIILLIVRFYKLLTVLWVKATANDILFQHVQCYIAPGPKIYVENFKFLFH